jgi:hypothetical protein
MWPSAWRSPSPEAASASGGSSRSRAWRLVFLAVTLGPDRWRVRFKQFLGVLGVVALLAPRAFVDAGTRFAYTGAEGCTWHEWVYPATRVIGLGYILVAVDELRGE